MTERHEQIEAYVSGQMTPTEETAFLQEMERDQELSALVQTYQEVDSSLSDEDLMNFVGMLGEVNQEYQEKQRAAGKSSISWMTTIGGKLAIAASISLVALCTYLFWPISSADPQVWFDQYFEPYTYQSIRATDDRYPADLTIALELYQKGNYQAAIAGLVPRIDDQEYQIAARFYLSQALLADRQTNRAIVLLEQQLSGQPTVFDQTNEWSLALAYLGAGRMMEARDVARLIISTSGHSYATQALELLNAFPE